MSLFLVHNIHDGKEFETIRSMLLATKLDKSDILIDVSVINTDNKKYIIWSIYLDYIIIL